MAEFVTRCPQCRNELKVQEEWIGQKAGCPACKKEFTIPAQTAEKGIIIPELLEKQASLFKSNSGVLPTDMTAVPGRKRQKSPESTSGAKKIIITLSIIIAVLLGSGAAVLTIIRINEKRIAAELKPAQALGILFSDDGKKLIKCPENIDVQQVIIPPCVTVIEVEAFARCKNLTEVIIPDGVTVIGDYAFDGCENLTAVNIPDSVTRIGSEAFVNTKLQSVTIPDSVTHIGDSTFHGVESVKVAKGNQNFYTDDHGVLIDRKYKRLLYCPPSISGNYTIPSSITKICDNAFSGCKNLTAITIPYSVTSIGEYAFDGCENLTAVYIPQSVERIDSTAFRNCKNLRSATVSNNYYTSNFFPDECKITYQ